MIHKYVKRPLVILAVCILAAGAFSGCDKIFKGNFSKNRAGIDLSYTAFHRDIKDVDFSGVTFTPWDVASASAKVRARKSKPYTVMVYMNGSDLESEAGAATKDLLEMLNSGLKQESANLVIFTGGTNRWQNNAVPSSTCSLWEIADGKLNKITDIGLLNMGNAGTLSGFVDFGVSNFPADKYGFIFWDHGGGSIAGFGHDEKFKNGTLSLLEINYAFEKSKLKERPLEFLGFDSCLMASAEMAVVASDYARYLIASEDLEPGDGWDYRFLSVLNNGALDGARLGKDITDSFMRFYGPSPALDLTLSVADLSAAKELMESMGKLMNTALGDLAAKPSEAFRALSKKRGQTKTFGIGSPRDNESDMVDLAETARSLADSYPAEAGAVLAALNKAVVYNRHNSDLNLGGLSAFYIYGGKRTASESLEVYSTLKMDRNYTAYLQSFYTHLKNNSGFTFPWSRSSGRDDIKARINGHIVSLYKISGSYDRRLYAAPVSVNGRDADIIVAITKDYPQGLILGSRNEEGFIIQKGFDPIESGDKISFYYPKKGLKSKNNAETDWRKGSEFTVNGELKLEAA